MPNPELKEELKRFQTSAHVAIDAMTNILEIIGELSTNSYSDPADDEEEVTELEELQPESEEEENILDEEEEPVKKKPAKKKAPKKITKTDMIALARQTVKEVDGGQALVRAALKEVDPDLKSIPDLNKDQWAEFAEKLQTILDDQ